MNDGEARLMGLMSLNQWYTVLTNHNFMPFLGQNPDGLGPSSRSNVELGCLPFRPCEASAGKSEV